jgi:hypothetical protein
MANAISITISSVGSFCMSMSFLMYEIRFPLVGLANRRLLENGFLPYDFGNNSEE